MAKVNSRPQQLNSQRRGYRADLMVGNSPDVGSSAVALALSERAAVHAELWTALQRPATLTAIARSATKISSSLSAGGTIFFCGNGGSAADAQHLAAEFVGRYQADRRPLAAIALGSSQAVASALANDYGYAEAGLARELEALGSSGDVLVALSTSGRSPNVLSALTVAGDKGIAAIALTGQGHQLGELCADVVEIDSTSVALIQEMHSVVGHVICELVERELGFA